MSTLTKRILLTFVALVACVIFLGMGLWAINTGTETRDMRMVLSILLGSMVGWPTGLGIVGIWLYVR